MGTKTCHEGGQAGIGENKRGYASESIIRDEEVGGSVYFYIHTYIQTDVYMYTYKWDIKELKSNRVVMGTNLKRRFLKRGGSDYELNTVRVSGNRVRVNDRVRGGLMVEEIVGLALKAGRRRVLWAVSCTAVNSATERYKKEELAAVIEDELSTMWRKRPDIPRKFVGDGRTDDATASGTK